MSLTRVIFLFTAILKLSFTKFLAVIFTSPLARIFDSRFSTSFFAIKVIFPSALIVDFSLV